MELSSDNLDKKRAAESFVDRVKYFNLSVEPHKHPSYDSPEFIGIPEFDVYVSVKGTLTGNRMKNSHGQGTVLHMTNDEIKALRDKLNEHLNKDEEG